MDLTSFSTYCYFYVPFIPKIVVNSSCHYFLSSHSLMNPLPSCLCSHQSTDTALSQLINGMTSMFPDNLILLIDLPLAGPPSAASSSSLGPVTLFCLLIPWIQFHGFKYYPNAYEFQIYVFRLYFFPKRQTHIFNSLTTITTWVSDRHLKLNKALSPNLIYL